MREVFERIIDQLKAESIIVDDDSGNCVVEIIEKAAAEYRQHKETIMKLLSGEWVDTDKVQEALGMSFSECFSMLEFSRSAEWWSVVGETEEERAREGQKIVTKFRLKNCDNGWIPADNPPEDDSYILLSFSNVSVPLIGRYKEEDGGGAYYIGDEGKSCVSQDMFVNAWQPLPKPYRETGMEEYRYLEQLADAILKYSDDIVERYEKGVSES